MKKTITILGILILIIAAVSTTTAFGDEESLHDAAIALAESYYNNYNSSHRLVCKRE